MAYSPRDKHWSRRLSFLAGAFILAIVIVVVVRSRAENEPREVRVFGTGERSGFVVDEEVSVFEDPVETDVVSMDPALSPDSPAAADPSPAAGRPATPAQPAPVSAAARERARAALPRYQAAIAEKRGDPLLLNNYAWSLHTAGRYAEAESALREVIKIAPSRAIAYANLGETLWKQGKNEEAAAMYRRFLELNTDPRRERIAQGKVAAITGSR